MAPIYERLAHRLDELPHGYPRTSSGVELRILEHIFSEEDAAFALRLRPVPETAAQIARRLKLPLESAEARLLEMARRGQIGAFRLRGKSVYCLVPFVVGIWEFQLPHIDARLAELFEEYAPHLLSTIGGAKPALARVVPVNRRIEARAEVLPYASLREMLRTSRTFRLMECLCRKEAALMGRPCPHTLETCLSFSPEPEATSDLPQLGRPISREEAFAVLDKAEDEGLVHCTYNLQRNQMFVCNCCDCCCGFLRGVAEFGAPHLLVRSDWVAAIDAEACTACGVCAEERCPMGAITATDDTFAVNDARCIGCGVCTLACPTDAIELRERPAAERDRPPANLGAWAMKRTANRFGPLRSLPRLAAMTVDAIRLQRALRPPKPPRA